MGTSTTLDPDDYGSLDEMRQAIGFRRSLLSPRAVNFARYKDKPVKVREDIGRVKGWSMGDLFIHFKSGKKRGGYDPKFVQIITEEEYAQAGNPPQT